MGAGETGVAAGGTVEMGGSMGRGGIGEGMEEEVADAARFEGAGGF